MGGRSWWKVTDKLTGLVVSNINLSSSFNVNDINTHFQSVNKDINFVEPALLEIMPELHKVPVIHETSVFKVLAHVKRTATGPDDLPFWFWKEYALELTPVITHILNVFLVSRQVPKIWKTVHVRPIPKETNISASRPAQTDTSHWHYNETFWKVNPRFRIEETGFLLYSLRSVCL